MTRPTVLLFDIDGTLLSTGGAGKRAILRALETWGRGFDADLGPETCAFPFGGMTDRAIVRRGLEESGLPASESAIDSVLDHYVDALTEEVSRSAAGAYRVHRGVAEVLDAVGRRGGVAVGLGTGNIERGARIKLGHVGLAERFAFGGFGCDSESRPELILAGARRGAARLGHPIEACRVVVIGDTWRDIHAARAIGAECLAVATGGESLESLRSHEPTCLFPDLTAPGALAALLDATGTDPAPRAGARGV